MDAYLQNTLSNWSKSILKSFLQQFGELTKINVIGDNKICLWINLFKQALCASSVSQCKFILRVICRKHAPKRTNLCVRENPGKCAFQINILFLAHLSTKCSWWAIVVSGCPSFVVVRRASTFDVYTLETTFVTWFWWNLIRMFVLTISRPSSNMGHVGSKTRSPGQILGNSCLHHRGHICDPILMKLCQNVCFDNI